MSDGILASLLPDLGAISDDSKLVGVKGGAGSFDAEALRDYLTPDLTDFGITAAAVTDATMFAGTNGANSNRYPATALRAYLRQGDTVRARDFGAVGDGVADDTIALQAAINYLVTRGGVLDLGAGIFKTSATLSVNESAETAENVTRISIVGQGRGSTQILATQSSGPAINLLGGAVASGFHSHQRLEGFRIVGNGLCSGVTGDNLAFLTVEDVQVLSCLFAFSLSDCVSTAFTDCVIRDNRYGFFFQRTDMTYPNAIKLDGCFIGNNTEYGIHCVGPTTFQVYGGSVEGNGWGATGPGQWGIKVDNAGYEGGVGLVAVGVYFEYNQGTADIWLDQAINNASHNVVGCTFNRASAAHFTGWNIYSATAATDVYLSVQGCAFRALNDYAEDAGRPYLNLSTRTHSDLGHANYYGNAVAAPRHSATPDFCAGISAPVVIPASTWTSVPLNQAVWDAQSNYDPAAFQFSPRRRCRVAVQAQVYLTGLSALADVQLAIYTTGGTLIRKTQQVAPAANACFALNCMIDVDATTTYYLRLFHTGGGAVSVSGDASVSFLQVRAA